MNIWILEDLNRDSKGAFMSVLISVLMFISIAISISISIVIVIAIPIPVLRAESGTAECKLQGLLHNGKFRDSGMVEMDDIDEGDKMGGMEEMWTYSRWRKWVEWEMIVI